MDVKSRLGCELSQFPATVGGVRTAQTFATALIHCFSSSSSSSSPTSSSCQAAWPAAAGQSRKLWREETLAAPRRETPRFPNEHTDPAEQSRAELPLRQNGPKQRLGSGLDSSAFLSGIQRTLIHRSLLCRKFNGGRPNLWLRLMLEDALGTIILSGGQVQSSEVLLLFYSRKKTFRFSSIGSRMVRKHFSLWHFKIRENNSDQS